MLGGLTGRLRFSGEDNVLNDVSAGGNTDVSL